MRYSQLDSLRGLAASSVVLFHTITMFPLPSLAHNLVEYSPLRLFFSGSESVILFFVLSGFVLSLPFYKGPVNYPSYLMKRILRIYTPYILTLFSVITLHTLFYSGTIQELSQSFNNIWSGTINLPTMIKEFFLLPSHISNLNPVAWSLVHEMRISIIFPFLMFFMLRLTFIGNTILAISFSAASVLTFHMTGLGNTGVELSNTLHYTSIFIVGSMLARNIEYVTGKIKSISVRKKVLLLGAGLFMYLYAKPSFVIGVLFNANAFYKSLLDMWVVSIGSCFIIVISLSSFKASKLLDIRFIKRLGDYSYGIYLVHMPITYTMMHLLNSFIPNIVICIVSLFLTYIISSVMYFCVEKPSIRLGKILTSNTTVKRTSEQA